MRREADRIWSIIDYVFEPPAQLSRDEKARLILTELRDRMGFYRDARKLRAPTTMIKRMGISAPRTSGESALDGQVQEEKKPDLLYPSLHGGEVTAPDAAAMAGQVQGANGSPETTRRGSMSGTAGSGEGGMADDLMADIDWVSRFQMSLP